MKNLLKLIVISLTLVLILSTSVYATNIDTVEPNSKETENIANSETTQSDKKDNKNTTEVFEIPEKGTTVATVNEHKILSDEVNELYHYISRQYAGAGRNIKGLEKQIYSMAIETAIQKYIVLQKAHELKLDVPSDEEMQSIKKSSQEMYDNTFKNILERRLGKNPTEEKKKAVTAELLAEMQKGQFTVENIIKSNLEQYAINKVQESIVKDINVSDEEIKNKYNENVEKSKKLFSTNILYYEQAIMQNKPTWYTPSGYRGIKHILLKVDDELMKSYKTLKAELEEASKIHNEEKQSKENADKKKITQKDIDEAYNKIMESVDSKIKEIKSKIKNNVSFDDLVTEYGTDPGMKVEPYKTEGYRVHQDSFLYDPAFTKAAYTIKNINEYSEPILGMYGVHILYYAGDIPEGPVDLNDSNKEILKKEVYGAKSSEAINNTISSWMKDFKITKNY